MNVFTIRDIENLCGIKAHTIRVWEIRYNFFCPRRKAGNHRLYDSEDLKHLLRVAYLYHHGYKISTLAKLGQQEISQLALAFSPTGNVTDIFVNQLTEASLDFDQELFDKILQTMVLQMGFEKAMTEVVYPFLKRIGLLWLTGNVVPAQEHFASALIMQKILTEINGLEEPLGSAAKAGASQKIVLLFTPKGEFHEIPLLYMRYLMKRAGTSTIYFGINIDLDELTFYCAERPVTHLYFHLVTNLLRCEPNEYIQKLTDLFPDKQIVVSGCLATQFGSRSPRLRALCGVEEMLAFAAEK